MLHVLLPVMKMLSDKNFLFIVSELQNNEMNSIKETGLTKQQSYAPCVYTILYRASILSVKYRCHFLSVAHRMHYPTHRTANTLVVIAEGSEARCLSQYSQ